MKKQMLSGVIATVMLTTTVNAATVTNIMCSDGKWSVTGNTNDDASLVVLTIENEEDEIVYVDQQNIEDDNGFNFKFPNIYDGGHYSVKVRDSSDSEYNQTSLYLAEAADGREIYNSDNDNFSEWSFSGENIGGYDSENGYYSLGAAGNDTNTGIIKSIVGTEDYTYSLSFQPGTQNTVLKVIYRYQNDSNYCYVKFPVPFNAGEKGTVGVVYQGVDTALKEFSIPVGTDVITEWSDVKIECLGGWTSVYVKMGEAAEYTLVSRIFNDKICSGTVGISEAGGLVRLKNVVLKNSSEIIRCGRFEFTSDAGNKIYDIPEDGIVNASIDAQNVSKTENFNGVMLGAVYDNGGRLKRVSLAQDKAAPGAVTRFSMRLEGLSADERLKVMLWSDDGTQRPVTFADTLEAGEAYQTIYVDNSYSGEVTSDGNFETPFTTLEEALDMVKDTKDIRGDKGANVIVREGVYNVSSTLSLDGEDYSGDSARPLIISAYNGEEVALTGSKKIDLSNAEQVNANIDDTVQGKIFCADLGISVPDIAEFTYGTPASYCTNVIINGEDKTVARYPNAGHEDIKDDYMQLDATTTDTTVTISLPEGAKSRAAKWTASSDAFIAGYFGYYWAYENLPVSNITAGGVLNISKKPTYDIVDGMEYYIYNLLSELDTPDEYYIDRDAGKIYYYAEDITAAQSAEMYVSTLSEPVISIANANNIVIDGININTTSGMGISVRNSMDIEVTNAEIKNIGAQGINVSKSSDVDINNSVICDTGATGIFFNDCGDNNTLTSGNCSVQNSEIYNFGKNSRSYTPGVWMSGGAGNSIAHNKIHGGTHSAIVFSGSEHTIEYNEIYDVVAFSSDAGAIYCGRSYTNWGTEISNNYIHDIYDNVDTEDTPVVAIFLDDMMSGVTIASNIFYKVDRGIFVSGGRDNVITNNIIAQKVTEDFGDESPVNTANGNAGRYSIFVRATGTLGGSRDTMVADMVSKIDNIDESVWSNKYPLVYSIPTPAGKPVRNEIYNNVIWNHHGIDKCSSWASYATDGKLENNLINSCDPGFIDEANGDLRMNENSAVYNELPDFKEIPFEKIGIQN